MTVGTIVLVDLVGYSDIQRILEETLGVAAARDFDAQIQGFIGASLADADGGGAGNVVMTTGDGAILAFAAADPALDFAARLHVGAARHNAGVTDAAAKRVFRIGIATGPLAFDEKTGAPSGVAITCAARLEEKADPGGALIDRATYKAASPALRAAYDGPETVEGKRDERFEAWRARIDGAAHAPVARPLSHAQSVLQIDRDMARLTPDRMAVLAILLDIPRGQRAPDTLTLARQGAMILQWAHDEGLLADLADALRGLLGTPEG